ASVSPLASTRADLQSIIPAPVSSRSLRTISAEMLIRPSSFGSGLEDPGLGEPRGPAGRRGGPGRLQAFTVVGGTAVVSGPGPLGRALGRRRAPSSSDAGPPLSADATSAARDSRIPRPAATASAIR